MEIKELLKRLQRIIIFGIFYMATFYFIEARTVPIHIIHTKLDDIIPFCEYFIVPYVFWYAYVCGTVLYLGLTDKTAKEYYRLITNMILGMVVFVIISFVYPNGQNLRPVLTGDSIFIRAVKLLYTIDTSTNILPSLHVFLSVACDLALCRSPFFQKYHLWKGISHLITIIICLSTMFLKQHSILDVIAALFCNILFYQLIYCNEKYVERHHLRKHISNSSLQR